VHKRVERSSLENVRTKTSMGGMSAYEFQKLTGGKHKLAGSEPIGQYTSHFKVVPTFEEIRLKNVKASNRNRVCPQPGSARVLPRTLKGIGAPWGESRKCCAALTDNCSGAARSSAPPRRPAPPALTAPGVWAQVFELSHDETHVSRILVGPSPSLVDGVAEHARVELLPGADAVKSAMIALGAAPRAPAPAAPSCETIVPCNHRPPPLPPPPVLTGHVSSLLPY
jgi:hypothetical protein